MGRANVIVLGGGEDQLPAYLEGRRLGYRVIGVDQRPDALGAAVADEFVCITTREPEAIADRLGPIDVAAVLSPGSDVAQPAVLALSRIYATASRPAPLAVRASVDKVYFRSVVDRLGLPGYRYVEGGETDELLAAAGRFGVPVIVKPADSSGSRGLHLVTDPADLRHAIDRMWKHSHGHRGVVEELVEGRHGSVECFLRDGEIRFMAVTDRALTGPPSVISLSHLVPADLPADVRDRLARMISEVCAAIGHRLGPINLDFVVAADGEIYLIEMGARLGGNGLPLLIDAAYGVNTVEAAIRLGVGEPVDLAPTRHHSALLHIIHSTVDGLLAGPGDLAAVRAVPEVVDVRLFANPGDRVRAYTHAGNKLGYLIVAAATPAELMRARDRALDALRLRIEPAETAPEDRR